MREVNPTRVATRERPDPLKAAASMADGTATSSEIAPSETEEWDVANNCYVVITLEGPEAEVDRLLRRHWDLGGKSNTTTRQGLIWRLPQESVVSRSPNRFTIEGIVAWGVDGYDFERVSREFPDVLVHVTWTVYEHDSVGARAYREGARIEDHQESLAALLARHGYRYDDAERWWFHAGEEPPHHFGEFLFDERKYACLHVGAV